ncbi:MAG TPA: MFS transporter [Drouetiella sp.]
MQNLDTTQKFVRDGFTWLGYLLVASCTYTISCFGPFMPFLRSELHLTYTVGALHFSAWAVGVLLAGLTGDTVMQRLGRQNTIWAGMAGICTGILLIVLTRNPVFTIFGALLGGLSGSTMGQTINTIMSDRFGSERALAITEANIIASISCFLAPLAVSTAMRYGINWRIAMVIPLISFASLFLIFRRKQVPGAEPAARKRAGAALPLAYWAYWIVILLNVGCEWSLIFWSAEFLEKVVKLSRIDASACVSVFLAAMLLGRIVGSRLTRNFDIHTLLPIAAITSVVGFALYWLGNSAIISVTGLFITGLGIANFYPMTLSAAIAAASDRAASATSRMSLGTGSAILLAPLVLGFIADRSSIFAAYGLVAALLTTCTLMVFVANRLAHRHEKHLEKLTNESKPQSASLC